jgi:inorganic pyrophosphatase
MAIKNPEYAFWIALDALVEESEIVIDRPKGSHHTRYPKLVYPVDYGYLKNTSSMDGGGIDVWRGTDAPGKIDAIICTVDLYKKDSEIKILIGCSAAEKALIMDFHNRGLMKAILIER